MAQRGNSSRCRHPFRLLPVFPSQGWFARSPLCDDGRDGGTGGDRAGRFSWRPSLPRSRERATASSCPGCRGRSQATPRRSEAHTPCQPAIRSQHCAAIVAGIWHKSLRSAPATRSIACTTGWRRGYSWLATASAPTRCGSPRISQRIARLQAFLRDRVAVVAGECQGDSLRARPNQHS